MRKKRIKKSAPKPDKAVKPRRGRPRKAVRKLIKKQDRVKLALKEIRKDIKKAKKSKQRMQLLWYRTKKEHVALLKDIETRLKALKKALAKK